MMHFTDFLCTGYFCNLEYDRSPRVLKNDTTGV